MALLETLGVIDIGCKFNFAPTGDRLAQRSISGSVFSFEVNCGELSIGGDCGSITPA